MEMRHRVLCRIAGGLLATALASGCSFSSNIGAKDAVGR
jgi:hypothetical protein